MADRKRVLVADDDPDLLELMRSDLDNLGYEVSCAANGEIALQIAQKEKPDLMLLDVMMPKMDGYHVAYEITSKMGAGAPKIIIMTSRDTLREKGVAAMSGAMTVLQKPFGMAELRNMVAEVLAANATKEKRDS